MDRFVKIEKTVEWLREKVEEANCKGLVVGVSGGIDSAVVANLIKKAYPDNSLGVIILLQYAQLKKRTSSVSPEGQTGMVRLPWKLSPKYSGIFPV